MKTKKVKKVKGWVLLTKNNNVLGASLHKKEVLGDRSEFVFWGDYSKGELKVVPCEITYKI